MAKVPHGIGWVYSEFDGLADRKNTTQICHFNIYFVSFVVTNRFALLQNLINIFENHAPTEEPLLWKKAKVR